MKEIINDTKELVERLNAGVKIHSAVSIFKGVDVRATEKIMKEAANKIEELQKEIHLLKSDEPFGWWVDDTEKYSNEFFMKNKRSILGGPTDEWEEKYKDQLIPVFKHSKPKVVLLTNNETPKRRPYTILDYPNLGCNSD